MKELDHLVENLKGAYVDGFAIVSQFYEITFKSQKFDKIVFNLDCDLQLSDFNIEDRLEFLKQYDFDTYQIAYFPLINLKEIVNVKISLITSELILVFENQITLTFNFIKNDSDLTISFWKNYSLPNDMSITFTNEGVTNMNMSSH